MESEVDRLFKNLFVAKNPLGLLSESVWQPPTDVFETSNEIVICMEIPSVNEQDFSIFVVEDVLTIKGEKKNEHEDRQEDHYRLERTYGSFHRSIALPAGIDQEKAEAAIENGVLTVRFPKLPEAQKRPKNIEVKAG